MKFTSRILEGKRSTHAGLSACAHVGLLRFSRRFAGERPKRAGRCLRPANAQPECTSSAETIYIPPSAKVNQCWGFIEAVQEYSSLADQNGKTLLDACPGENITTVDFLHEFVSYLQKYPEKLTRIQLPSA